MITAKVKYLGTLRNELIHINSGEKVITDAPLDNHGKGMAFSPTDMAATSLASCMMTVIGIACEGRNITIDSMEAEVTKVMASNPRRISEIHVKLSIVIPNVDNHTQQILKEIGYNCPVALSLHPDVKQVIDIDFV